MLTIATLSTLPRRAISIPPSDVISSHQRRVAGRQQQFVHLFDPQPQSQTEPDHGVSTGVSGTWSSKLWVQQVILITDQSPDVCDVQPGVSGQTGNRRP